jgi:hypothetical protein
VYNRKSSGTHPLAFNIENNKKKDMDEELEQKIKDYLWFHLSKENKETLKNYFSKNNHWATGKENIIEPHSGIEKIMPKTELVYGMIHPDYKFEDGKI